MNIFISDSRVWFGIEISSSELLIFHSCFKSILEKVCVLSRHSKIISWPDFVKQIHCSQNKFNHYKHSTFCSSIPVSSCVVSINKDQLHRVVQNYNTSYLFLCVEKCGFGTSHQVEFSKHECDVEQIRCF